jgi:hypothetical protein
MHIQANHRSPANASRALDEQVPGVRIADRFGFVAMEQPVVHVAFTTAFFPIHFNTGITKPPNKLYRVLSLDPNPRFVSPPLIARSVGVASGDFR